MAPTESDIEVWLKGFVGLLWAFGSFWGLWDAQKDIYIYIYIYIYILCIYIYVKEPVLLLRELKVRYSNEEALLTLLFTKMYSQCVYIYIYIDIYYFLQYIPPYTERPKRSSENCREVPTQLLLCYDDDRQPRAKRVRFRV